MGTSSQIFNQETDWLNSIKDLKRSYWGTYRLLLRERRRFDENDLNTIDVVQEIDEMLSDVMFSITWMHTGRRPGNKRGVERRSAYQREKLMDPVRMQSFAQNTVAGGPSNLTNWQRFQISDALSRLSSRERECYVMKHGECHSFAEIAELLQISKSSVEEYVNRAQKKISEELMSSLFLME